MSPLYRIGVEQPGGYSLELTERGETLMYRSAELDADASVGWTEEGGQLRALLYASTLRRRGSVEPPTANVEEILLERMASYRRQWALAHHRRPVGSAPNRRRDGGVHRAGREWEAW